MDDFPCTQCSLCCRNISNVLEADFSNPILTFLISKFPYKSKEDGSCEMLSEDGLCKVYHDRPLICNVKLVAIAKGQDLIEYYREFALYCNTLIVKADLDPKYFVYIEQASQKTDKTAN